MKKTTQIYYNAVFGAIGGLVAWLLIGQFPTGDWSLWPAVAFVGAGAGLFIGGAVGMVEGAVLKRSPVQAVLGLISGGLVGMLSGLVGLLVGQAGFLITGGGFVGRALGWTALGFCLGAGQGLINRKPKRAFYGLVGGTLAGLVGGLIYEGVTQLFLHRSDTVQVFLGALGLTLIGASLGGITALSVEVSGRMAGRGLLVVKNGRRAGMEVSVTDTVTLGSYDGCEVYLPGDKAIAKQHARVGKGDQYFRLQDLGSPSGTYVGNARVPATGQVLTDGDQIRLGDTVVEFRAR
jgi:hypothetical protein